MRVVSKIICGIFLIFALFIVVNFVIGAIQYGGTKNYSEYLNSKTREETISQVYLLKPKTWLSVFYEVESVNTGTNNNEDNNVVNIGLDEVLSGDDESEIQNVNHNPYDPDYEDEFNSFFGTSSEYKTGEIISVQEIENIEDLGDAGFNVDGSTED